MKVAFVVNGREICVETLGYENVFATAEEAEEYLNEKLKRELAYLDKKREELVKLIKT